MVHYKKSIQYSNEIFYYLQTLMRWCLASIAAVLLWLNSDLLLDQRDRGKKKKIIKAAQILYISHVAMDSVKTQ